MASGELPGLGETGTSPIVGARMAWRLYGSRKDRAKGKPTTEDQAHFENLAELERHRSQLRMTEEANKANIRDLELSRSAEHLKNRITAARGASQIVIDGHVMGEVTSDDKALGLRLGGYKRADIPSASREDAPSPVAEAEEKKDEASLIPGAVAAKEAAESTAAPAAKPEKPAKPEVSAARLAKAMAPAKPKRPTKKSAKADKARDVTFSSAGETPEPGTTTRSGGIEDSAEFD